jgi:hypothetical protein
VIEDNFHRVEGAKSVGSSGNYSDFVVEVLNGAVGDFSSGPKPVQYQRLMGAQHRDWCINLLVIQYKRALNKGFFVCF